MMKNITVKKVKELHGEEKTLFFEALDTGSYFIEILMKNYNGVVCLQKENDLLDSVQCFRKDKVELAATLRKDISYNIKFTADIERYTFILYDISEPQNRLFKYQWSLFNRGNGIDINILPAWKYSLGEGVRVGIADTMVDSKHPALIESLNTELSDKFNKYYKKIDDMNQYKSHATHIAGIIAACDKSYGGIIGVAPRAEIVSLELLGKAVVGQNDKNVTDIFVYGINS